MNKNCLSSFNFSVRHIFNPVYKGHFAGIASTFNRDRQGDRIYPQAFNSSITIWRACKKNPPIYWEHNSNKQIGEIVLMRPVLYGLYIEGSIYPYFDYLINQFFTKTVGLSVSITMLDYSRVSLPGRFDIKKAFIREISLTENPINREATTFLNKQIRYTS